MLDVPILFLIDDNSCATQVVFNTIKVIKPSRVYIAALYTEDNEDDEDTNEHLAAMAKQVSWKCQLKTRLCKKGFNEYKAQCDAIDWFFRGEEMGIILNTKFLVSQCFFQFAEFLLFHYKNDQRVMYINSCNYQLTDKIGDGNYHFSKYNQMGAWGTWRRAWLTIQPNLNNLNRALSLRAFDDILSDKEFDYWIFNFNKFSTDLSNAYNYKTLLSQWLNNGLAITPNVNLAYKIDRSNANRTFAEMCTEHQKATFDMLEVRHPTFFVKNKIADDFTFHNYYLKLGKKEKKNVINPLIRKYLVLINKKKTNIVKNKFSLMSFISQSITNNKTKEL